MKIVIIFVNFVKNVSLADESWYYTYQFETNLYKKLYVVFLCDFLNLCNMLWNIRRCGVCSVLKINKYKTDIPIAFININT